MQGATALVLAVMQENQKMVELLLMRGANLDIGLKTGDIPLFIAVHT